MDDRYEVTGIRDVDYTNNQGRRIIGRVLYTQYCRRDTVGVAVLEMYVPGNAAVDVHVGDCVTPLYNRRGKVVSVVMHGADAV